MKQRMKFSVILPVCHGGVFLEKALDSLGQIDFPINRFEVIVAATHFRFH
jgi:glycosyltransferase involved in cell wall biosynthesis